MDMQSAISTINNPVVGAIAAAFGCGAFLNEVRAGVKAVFSWLKSSQGQEAVQDIEAALPIVINVLNQSKHPQAAAIAAQLQQVVASAQDAAAPPAAPIGGASATPGKLGVWFVLVGLLALGAGLSATTYDLSVGSPVGSSTWQFGPGGSLISEGSTVAGLGLVASYGAMELSGTAATYQPYIAIMAGVGGETRNSSNYADAFIGLGPVLPLLDIPCFAAANFRCGTGQAPCIMLCTSISYNLSLWRSK